MTQQLKPHPSIVAALKSAMPGATDQMLVGAWKQALAQNPQLAGQNPQTLAKGIMGASTVAKQKPQRMAEGGVVEENPATAPITVPSVSANPYAGAGYTPTDLLKQYSPDQVRQANDPSAVMGAYQDQQEWFNRTNPQRQAAAMFGAMVPGSTAAKDFGEGQEKQQMLQTIGKQSALLGFNQKQQEALQAGATQGLAAGKSVVGIADDVQKLFGAHADNVIKSLNTQQQQRFDDPSSTETLSAKQALLAQVSTLPPDIKQKLGEIINDPTATARKLAPLMAQYVPAAYKAFTDAAGIGKTVAETAGQVTKNINLQQQGAGYSEQQGQPAPQYPNPAGGVAPVGGGTSGNNFGNMRPQGANTGFQSYATPEEGLAAVDKNLQSYGKQGVNTLSTIISRWAPPSENDTASYIKDVSSRLGVDPNKPLDLNNPAVRQAVSTAIIIHEQGGAKLFGGTSPAAPTPKPVVAPVAGAGRGFINPPMAGQPQPSFQTLQGSLAQPDNLDPNYIANAKESDLSPVQKLVRQRLESTDQAEVVALDRQIAKATGKPYIAPGSAPTSIYTPSGEGTFSTTTDAAQRLSDARARTQAKSDSVETFNASGRPAAQNAYVLSPASGWNKGSNWSPDTDENAKKLDIAVNRLNAEAARLGQLVAGPSNTGAAAAAGALGNISPLLGAAAGAFASLNQSQAITSRSPQEVIKMYSVATQVAAERQKLLLSKEHAWAVRNNGDVSGFVNSPDYKFIMNSEPYVNPTTGDVKIPVSRSQQDELLKTKSWGPLSRISFSTPKVEPGAPADALTRAAMSPTLGQ